MLAYHINTHSSLSLGQEIIIFLHHVISYLYIISYHTYSTLNPRQNIVMRPGSPAKNLIVFVIGRFGQWDICEYPRLRSSWFCFKVRFRKPLEINFPFSLFVCCIFQPVYYHKLFFSSFHFMVARTLWP